VAKLTRQQICERLQCTDEVIRKQVSLGTLIEVDNYIDTDHPINVKYISGRVSRMQSGKRVGRKVARHEKVPQIEDETFEQMAAKVGGGFSNELDELRAAKLVEETELLRMRKEKIQGELLPITLVQPVFVLFAKSMQTAFNDELEDMVLEVSHMAKLSKQQVAGLRSRIIATINKATETGVAESKKNIRKLTLEFQDTRGKGERK
jgi:hypothetical protein